MKGVAAWAVSVFLIAATAEAHVTVRPRESKAGATEKYTVRVPTEGKVATTSVEIEIPAGVTVRARGFDLQERVYCSTLTTISRVQWRLRTMTDSSSCRTCLAVAVRAPSIKCGRAVAKASAAPG